MVLHTITGEQALRPTDQVHGTDDAVDRLRADYDSTPYTSDAFPQSAPGQLAAIAHAFGLTTPEVPTARVLEIGCAAGGNQIPFAVTHPQARASPRATLGQQRAAPQLGEGIALGTQRIQNGTSTSSPNQVW